ncbi:MAG: ribonuclease P protein component [Proteobacteria bacterium]|nr:ribonuclease P protein component [Pseudomonadota bacterium]
MPEQSFPTTRRLLHSREFDAVFNQSDYRISHREVLILAKLNTLGTSRLGMVISKKNFPKAVARNRVKRSIREVFRRLPAMDLDIVVLGRRGADTPEGRRGIVAAFDELIKRRQQDS